MKFDAGRDDKSLGPWHAGTLGEIIYIGNNFAAYPLIGPGSQVGVLSHEMSHFNDVLENDDIALGIWVSRSLQLSCAKFFKLSAEKYYNLEWYFE
ncbi:hypothetical protein ACVR2I_004152 [Cronobacter sakazakii]